MEFKGNELFASGLKEDLREPDFVDGLLSLGIQKMPNILFIRSIHGFFKGTARLNFNAHEEALAFKAKVNYKQIKGRTIWLTPFVPDKCFKDKKNEKCNLFAKVPVTMTPEKLDQLMAKFGEIFSIKIKYDKANVSQGYGYVCFTTPNAAANALQAYSKGAEVDGGKITMFEFKSFSDRNPDGLRRNNLLIKNISNKWSDADFRSFVTKFGEVTSIKVAKEKEEDATNKGFGFACFKTVEMAEKALKDLNVAKVEDKIIIAAYHLKKEERKVQLQKERLRNYKDKNVFVKNLPSTVTDETLKKACEEFGKITSARVFIEKVKNQATNENATVSKCFGFVCFETTESALAMIDQLMHKGKKLWDVAIFAAIPEVKAERKKRIARPKRMNPPMGFPMPMPMNRPPPFMWDYMPMPMPPMMDRMPMMPPPQYPMPTRSMPTKQEFEAMEKNQLGEIIYERIIGKVGNPEVAGKITGMILEMEAKQIAEMLINPIEMENTFNEAMKALNEKGDK